MTQNKAVSDAVKAEFQRAVLAHLERAAELAGLLVAEQEKMVPLLKELEELRKASGAAVN